MAIAVGNAVEDCAGQCNGRAVVDCAGECNGNAVEDCAGECNGNAVEDCAGQCNGRAVVDCAGECNGNAVEDCAGECNGNAVEDCAGECNGNAVVDCAGECNGDAKVDCTGECGGNAVADCAGECNGNAVADCAGECNGNAVEDCAGECNGRAVVDCEGACGGGAALDLCGNCNGGNVVQLTIRYSISNPNNLPVTFASAQNGWVAEPMADEGQGLYSITVPVTIGTRFEYKAQVDGVWEGGANRVYDMNQQWALENQCSIDNPTHCWSPDVQAANGVIDNCGVCDDNPANDCEADCAGVFGGDAVADAQGGCCAVAEQDCAGICNGAAQQDVNGACCTPDKFDCAGVCDGVSAVDNDGGCCLADDLDCAGICNGGATVDICGTCDADPANDCQCNAENPCARGQICDDGQCIDPPEPQCDDLNPCPNGQACENGQCVEPEVGEPNAVDFCKLQWVEGFQGAEGDRLRIDVQAASQFNVYGRLYEGGMTDVTTGFDPNALIIAQVGYGPNGTNPNDPVSEPSWTWFDAAGNQNWDGTRTGNADDRGRDEYFGQITAPVNPASYAFAVRFSVDGGQSYTACDGGAGTSDGYQSIEAGRFTVLAIACRDELDCPVPDDPNCIAQCSGENTCQQICATEGCPDPTSDYVLYTSDDPQECRTIPDFGCGIIDNDGNGVSDGWVSFDTHCGCGCIDPAQVDIQCREGEFRCNDNTCIIMDWVCDDQAADCAGGEDEDPNNCPDCREDADCAAGEVCNPVTLECGAPPPCNGDGDCAEGEICDPATNQCVDAGGGACQGDADCPIGQQCNLQTNVCEDQGGCANDGDCAIDELCDIAAGQCIARCNGNADCAAGEICDLNSGVCQPEPAGCEADEFECGDGSCIQLAWRCDGWDFDCPGNADETCPEGQVCDAASNSCVDAPVNCAQNADCGDLQRCDLNSQQCIDVECVQDADCNQGQVCNQDNYTCVEDQPNGCANDADCNGQQCVDAVCQVCDPADNAGCDDPLKSICRADGSECVSCENDGHCALGEICFQNECRNQNEVCFADADCAAGQLCDNNECIAGCPDANDPVYESVTTFSNDRDQCNNLPGQLGANSMEEAAVILGCDQAAQVYDLVCGCGCYVLANGGGGGGCQADADCAAGQVCDLDTNACVDGGGGGLNCNAGEWACTDGSFCVNMMWVCEDAPWNDCTDGSDETPEACDWKAAQ